MRHLVLSAIALVALSGMAHAITTVPTNNIPEPATIAMLAIGAGFVVARKRRKQ